MSPEDTPKHSQYQSEPNPAVCPQSAKDYVGQTNAMATAGMKVRENPEPKQPGSRS